jgi:ligand-binding sensor domain-containing protein
MWAGTYFGLSRYDGRHWKSYSTRDSGIASDFINFQRAVGENLWIATDRGFSRFNSKTWHTWRQPTEEAAFELVHTGSEWVPERAPEARTNAKRMSNREYVELARKQPAGNMVYGIDMSGGDVWLATATGVYRGIAKASAAQAED